MRFKAILIVLALSTAAALLAVTPVKKKTTATKKTVAKASTVKSKSKVTAAAGKKGAAGKKSAAKQASSKQASQASRYRRSTQREPAPERYKEIQQSLAEKGYYSGPVNGDWGTDSVAALKHFQRDQNIGDDGKLGSLSLIALGLGPKRGEKSENAETSPTPP